MRIVVRRLGYSVVGVVAVGVRWALVDFQSGDFVAFVSRWWTYIDRRSPSTERSSLALREAVGTPHRA